MMILRVFVSLLMMTMVCVPGVRNYWHLVDCAWWRPAHAAALLAPTTQGMYRTAPCLLPLLPTLPGPLPVFLSHPSLLALPLVSLFPWSCLFCILCHIYSILHFVFMVSLFSVLCMFHNRCGRTARWGSSRWHSLRTTASRWRRTSRPSSTTYVLRLRWMWLSWWVLDGGVGGRGLWDIQTFCLGFGILGGLKVASSIL